ncbi:uncharacterized protein [Drosophila takahashii]|uniref:uncharacterized protein n=1 Tax=Drosophila takahashii TaxID=29030 RepID=UPI003898FFC4
MSEKAEESKEENVKEEVSNEGSSSSTSLLTLDTHPYFPFLFDPYSSSKYGSQVRERKIDRCLKQLQDALKGGKSNFLSRAPETKRKYPERVEGTERARQEYRQENKFQ